MSPVNARASVKYQRAQAVTEFIIAWPIILAAVCFTVQLLWLWWAQQTLHTATQYAVRTGAINHGNQKKMRRTLIVAMAGVRPQIDQRNATQAAAEAIIQQGLHYARYGRLRIVQPTDKQFQQFAQRRWNTLTQRYVKEIAVDHYAARYAASPNDAWAAARRLKIETQWCEDLRIPLAAALLGLIAKQRGQCLIGNSQGRPQWPLNSRAEHEMLSGYRQ